MAATIADCHRYLRAEQSGRQAEQIQVEAQRLSEIDRSVSDGDLLARLSELKDLVTSTVGAKRNAVQQNSVFLSCRFAEREFVRGLTDLLEKSGFAVVTGSATNNYIGRAILARIAACEYFLCLMTRDAQKADGTYTTSPWLLEEKGAALALEKPIVLMVENGVTDVGGLQGDWQRIEFGERGFLIAALQAVEQLNSYSGRSGTVAERRSSSAG